MQTTVVDRKCQHAKCFRPVRGQNKAIATGLQPGETPLHEVDTARHGREVYAFGRGAALDVGNVGFQSLLKNSNARSRFARASTQVCTTPLSVEPCEVRAR